MFLWNVPTAIFQSINVACLLDQTLPQIASSAYFACKDSLLELHYVPLYYYLQVFA